ncbi:tRNA (guanine-N(7)-)-methyltransferase [Polystyrenella longa]|uniref:tRNA (guanine-N(7)-)-methyltransferase n=1 Tax=Polystyrenella longa TaxID=2528007 RepID=A0A518CMV7_9PLAN|nr:tRNA (guanosine(46)-N7)-methyltransferase TrmB [Polystyrenella longa]QDU80543.1 tRNA (guanine-N(7)-)-methyltransferase [Polystyrenella longa]
MSRSVIHDLKPHFLAIDELPEQLDWQEYFGNDQPVELDIGCGRGLFVFRATEENPDRNYVGVELDFKKGRHGALRLNKLNRPNGRIWGGDANRVLDKIVRPHSIAAVHVYFPDPWWKTRHRRRRIFTNEFVNRVVNVLEPEGYLHFWTDVAPYWEVASALMTHDARFVFCGTPEEKEPEHDMDYRTSFERKKRKIGSTIHRGLWRLKPE